MKPPTCKVCQKAHWTYEDHYTGNSAITPDYIREMAAGALGETRSDSIPSATPPIKRTDVPNINKRDNKRTYSAAPMPETVVSTPPVGKRGRPKKWASEAERKRAYRERSRE